jgi:hypothetical protein
MTASLRLTCHTADSKRDNDIIMAASQSRCWLPLLMICTRAPHVGGSGSGLTTLGGLALVLAVAFRMATAQTRRTSLLSPSSSPRCRTD